MASASPRGYAGLPWDHSRALEAEAELAAWLCTLHIGKIIPAGLGPSFREHFKEKFPIDVFSTPDLVYVPEFSDEDGKVIGYGPPFAFDVSARGYTFEEFPTVYAQVSKTDDLARFDKRFSFLAYKWANGTWTFARIEDIASLKLKPKWVDTEVKGKKCKQKVYSIPKEPWYSQEEFKTLMLREIENFEPIDQVKLLRQIDEAREDEMFEIVSLLRLSLGEERFREAKKYLESLKAMIEWNPEHELEPALYILQRVLKEPENSSNSSKSSSRNDKRLSQLLRRIKVMDEARPTIEKPAEKVELSDKAREKLLATFIDLFKENKEADIDDFVKRVGKFQTDITARGLDVVLDRKEIDAFIAQLEKDGEIEKNDAGKYGFTDAGLTKYSARIFWYSKPFRLMFNPFATFPEAGVEGSRGIIAAPMIKRIEALISARSSAIIEGERGCGKSSVICWFKIDGPDVVTAISPRNVEGINRAIRSRVRLKLGRDAHIVNKIVFEQGITSEEGEKYKRAVTEVGREGNLFDVPDNLSPKAAFELADLCARILDEGGFIILFATLEQARLLKRLDTFARFPVIKFEHPSERFFYRLFASRVDASAIGEAPGYAIQVGQIGMTWKRTYPIDEKALEKAIKTANYNPRRFILICSRILTEMRERRMDKPLDEKAADELLKGADVLAEAPVDIDEALKAIMRESGSGGAKWVKVKDIRTALLERYCIDLRPETIGRRLTEMGYPKRYSPDAEYLAAEIARKDDGGTP